MTITPDGTTTYSYGTLGELQEVNTPTQTITYKHNVNNQRVTKLINDQVVEKYLWANLTTLLAVYDKDDNLVQRFEYADQRMPIAMTQNNQKYYLHYNQVGSLRAVSDSNQNIVKEIVYDTYGNIISDSNLSIKVPFGFAGGLYDSDTKLTRFGYRDYDVYTGKWTAKDPIGFEGGNTNLYGYVLGDPVNFVDPTGEAFTIIGGAIAGSIGGFVVGIIAVHETGATEWSVISTVAINTVTGGAIGAIAGAGNIGILAGVGMEVTGVGLSIVVSADSVADVLGDDIENIAEKVCHD